MNDQFISGLEHVEAIKERTMQVTKLRFTSPMQGLERPDSYGIYRKDNGAWLGTTGKSFRPLPINLLIDAIVEAVVNGLCLDLNTMEYREHYGGEIVEIRFKLATQEIKSRLVGDIVNRYVSFRVGYNGKVKTSLTEIIERLVCLNGMTSNFSQSLGFRNTQNNTIRIISLPNKIEKMIEKGNDFLITFEKSSDVEMTKEMEREFFKQVTGYDIKEYNDLPKKSQNILDAINESVAIEARDTGDTLFSWINGVTRYTTHNLNSRVEYIDDLAKISLNNTALSLNTKAMEFATALVNVN